MPAAIGDGDTNYFVAAGVSSHVYYVGENQHVYQLFFDGQGWSNQDVTASSGTSALAANGTGLSSYFVSADGSSHIYYEDTRQHTNELVFDSTGWYDLDLMRIYSLSGQISTGGTPVPGVTITLSGATAGATTSDANGDYSFGVAAGGSYTVTPSDESGDTFIASASQPFTNLSANQTVNFTNNGNGGYNPPPYPNFLNSVPTPGPGPANCADISGTWTDSNLNTWALLQSGVTVGGSLIQPNTEVVWQISGNGAGSQYTLTAGNPNPSRIGNVYEDGESLNWTSTSCNSASGPTTWIAPPGFTFASTGTSTEPGPTITLVRAAAPTYTLTSPSSSPVPGATNGAQFLAFSTGDSNVQLKTTASLLNISVDEVYTSVFQGDPSGTCPNGSHVTLSMPDGTGTGSATSSISASPAGCSGIFQIWGAGGGTTTNLLEVVVPPQIMIQTEVGEAGAQTQPGDDSMVALLLTAKNRFGDKRFPGASGGPAWTWQDALTAPGQYYGYVNTTPNGVQPELNYAASVYSGATTVDILNCEAYWSPTNAQFATLQSWANANTPANAISDPSWPNLVGAPIVWHGEPKQAVIKSSIGTNARRDRNDYNAAPAFVLFRQAPSGTAPAVITIP